MAGESARERYESLRSRRLEKARRHRLLILAVVAVAFAAGFLLPRFLAYMVPSVFRPLAPDATSTASPDVPLILSLAVGMFMAALVGTDLLRPTRAEVAWRKGASGERSVGRALDSLGSDGAHSIHDRLIPGSRANIDHLAVTPFGVFTIDAKRYTGSLEVRARRTELWINGRNRSKLLAQARRQAEVTEKILAGAGFSEVNVTPMLCFVDTRMPLFPPKHAGGVLLTTPRRLRSRLVPPKAAALDPVEVTTIFQILDSSLKPAGRNVAEGVDSAQVAVRGSGSPVSETAPIPDDGKALSVPDCPRCGQPMKVRTNKSDGSRFYGCSTFPACWGKRPLAG